MVLAGEFRCDGGQAEFTPVRVNWDALALDGVRIVPVIRAYASLDTLLDDVSAPRTAAQFIAYCDTVASSAAALGVTIDELQLDYDCPTSKLSRYAGLLREMRRARPALKLSITALPTWLGDSSLAEVLEAVDEWVFQVHSFERPAHKDDSLTVCRDDQVPGYITRAAKYGVPFHVALPTYAYDVAFDAAGGFAALAAEGGTREWPDSYTVRRVRTDAAAMAKLVAEFTRERPESMIGVVWFRLPVASDEMNWSWETLAQVMAGKAPEAHAVAELRYPEPGLAEVWVRGAMAGTRATITLPQECGEALAHDTFAGFTRTTAPDGGVQLAGEIDRESEEVLVAWFRMREGEQDEVRKLEVQCAR